jgi:hypothetical protein
LGIVPGNWLGQRCTSDNCKAYDWSDTSESNSSKKCTKCWDASEMLPYHEFKGKSSYAEIDIASRDPYSPWILNPVTSKCELACTRGYWSNANSTVNKKTDPLFYHCSSDNCHTWNTGLATDSPEKCQTCWDKAQVDTWGTWDGRKSYSPEAIAGRDPEQPFKPVANQCLLQCKQHYRSNWYASVKYEPTTSVLEQKCIMNNCKVPNDSDLPQIERDLAAYVANTNYRASADDLPDNLLGKKGIEPPDIVWDFTWTGMVYTRNGKFVKLSGTLLRASESRSAAIMFFFAKNYKTQCLKIETAFSGLSGMPTVFILELEFDGAIKYSSTHGCSGEDIPFEGDDCHCVTPVPMATFLLADDSPSYVTLLAQPELLPYHDSNGIFQITPAPAHDDLVNKFAGIYVSSSKLLNGKLVYLNQANDRFLCLGGVMANGRIGIRWVLAKGIAQLENLWTETSVPEWTTRVGEIEILSDIKVNGETSTYDLGNESLTPDSVTWVNYGIARIGGAPLTDEPIMPFQHMLFTTKGWLLTGIFQFAKFDSDQENGLSFFFAGVKCARELIYQGMFL